MLSIYKQNLLWDGVNNEAEISVSTQSSCKQPTCHDPFRVFGKNLTVNVIEDAVQSCTCRLIKNHAAAHEPPGRLRNETTFILRSTVNILNLKESTSIN